MIFNDDVQSSIAFVEHIQVSCEDIVRLTMTVYVGWAWVTKRKGCIIGGHLECNYLHPPSISIPLCGYVTTVETASYHEERLYGTPNLLSLVIDDRFSTRFYPRICDFPRPVSSYKWRQALLTANIRPHDDRSTRFHLLWLSLVWVRKHTFQSDYRTRCGNLMLFLHYLENTSWLRNLFCERKLPVMFH